MEVIKYFSPFEYHTIAKYVELSNNVTIIYRVIKVQLKFFKG